MTFKRTTFTAGEDVMHVKRSYMTGGSSNVIPLTWEEAAELHEWLGKELEKRRQ